MAHDKTPERNNLIFFYTVLSVLTLILLGFVFTSYFHIETERVVTEHVRLRPAPERQRLEREQEEQLRTGPVPIDRAMNMLAQEGRAPSVRPVESRDLAPLEGWNEAVVRPQVPATMVPAEGTEEESVEEGPAEDGETEDGEGQEEVAPEGAMGDTSPSPQSADAPTDEASEE